jgi:hypothetical protein
VANIGRLQRKIVGAYSVQCDQPYGCVPVSAISEYQYQ